MSENCCFSFRELFIAANGRDWTESERDGFNLLTQDQKNAEVRRMVALTSGTWDCEDRLWADGVTYTAFWKLAASKSKTSR